MSRARSDNLSPLDVFSRSDLSGKLALSISTWFGSGLVPLAPGTCGSLAGLPLILGAGCLPLQYRILCLIGLVPVAVWSAGRGEQLLKKKDPCEIVIDEVIGFWLTLVLFPLSLANLLIGFALFRFFDIVKPFPAGRAEGIQGGWGIVVDDLVAGIYACAGLALTQILFFG
jgi:phosphatidylglycerophosphatase A